MHPVAGLLLSKPDRLRTHKGSFFLSVVSEAKETCSHEAHGGRLAERETWGATPSPGEAGREACGRETEAGRPAVHSSLEIIDFA